VKSPTRALAAVADELELVAREHAPVRARLRRIAAELRGWARGPAVVARETMEEWGARAPPFWCAPGGLRLEAVRLDRRGVLRVRFASGAEYSVPPRQLGIRGRPVAAALDDLEHGIVLAFAGGRTTDIASDLVLHACEPAYDEAGMSRSPRAIGARIRALRLATGRSAAEVARAVGLARPNYSRLEAGRHEPRVQTLVRVAEALEVPLATLFDH
jgi:DNA-binding XRE family transcriptional regulator